MKMSTFIRRLLGPGAIYGVPTVKKPPIKDAPNGAGEPSVYGTGGGPFGAFGGPFGTGHGFGFGSGFGHGPGPGGFGPGGGGFFGGFGGFGGGGPGGPG